MKQVPHATPEHEAAFGTAAPSRFGHRPAAGHPAGSGRPSRTGGLAMVAAWAWASAAMPAQAGPVRYTLEPTHTYPSFEADHMGLSFWRGKFNRSSGHVWLDKAAGSGQVDITIDIRSIDFGLDKMNEAALSAELFDAERFPQATYRGRLAAFHDGAPTRVEGELTLHGVTRPVALAVTRFKCMPHPLLKRDWCGADAHATIDREQFGMAAGKDWGFAMAVDLRIQVEAIIDAP